MPAAQWHAIAQIWQSGIPRADSLRIRRRTLNRRYVTACAVPPVRGCLASVTDVAAGWRVFPRTWPWPALCGSRPDVQWGPSRRRQKGSCACAYEYGPRRHAVSAALGDVRGERSAYTAKLKAPIRIIAAPAARPPAAPNGMVFSSSTKAAIAAIHSRFITPPMNSNPIRIAQQPRQ